MIPKKAGHSTVCIRKFVCVFCFLPLAAQPGQADFESFDACMRAMLLTADDEITVGELRQQCTDAGIEDEQQSDAEMTGLFNFQESPFETYKPSYFSIGGMKNADGSPAFSGNSVDVKFQFSIKYRIFNPGFFLEPLHFAYTQTSWWDVGEDSLPFAEHNFNPEFFWELPEFTVFDYPLVSRLGVEHLSNGRNGAASRSLDRIYGEAELSLNRSFALQFKLWKTANLAEENPDYGHYLGNSSFGLRWRFSRELSLQLNSTKGNGNSKYNIQSDLIYRLPDGVNPSIFLTYYNGYGESLLSYRQKTESLRLGFFFTVPL